MAGAFRPFRRHDDSCCQGRTKGARGVVSEEGGRVLGQGIREAANPQGHKSGQRARDDRTAAQDGERRLVWRGAAGMTAVSALLLVYSGLMVPIQLSLWLSDDPCSLYPTVRNCFRAATPRIVHLPYPLRVILRYQPTVCLRKERVGGESL